MSSQSYPLQRRCMLFARETNLKKKHSVIQIQVDIDSYNLPAPQSGHCAPLNNYL